MQSFFPKRTCFARGRLSRRGVEIVLGLSLMALYRRKAYVGIIAALFFVAVFPGNIAQYRRTPRGIWVGDGHGSTRPAFPSAGSRRLGALECRRVDSTSTVLGQTRLIAVRSHGPP